MIGFFEPSDDLPDEQTFLVCPPYPRGDACGWDTTGAIAGSRRAARPVNIRPNRLQSGSDALLVDRIIPLIAPHHLGLESVLAGPQSFTRGVNALLQYLGVCLAPHQVPLGDDYNL